MNTQVWDATITLLAKLRRTVTSEAEYLHRLEQAVLIAQMGGVEDRTLEALLALAATRQLTPTVTRLLHDVGIDTRSWEEVVADAYADDGLKPPDQWEQPPRDLHPLMTALNEFAAQLAEHLEGQA